MNRLCKSEQNDKVTILIRGGGVGEINGLDTTNQFYKLHILPHLMAGCH